MDKNYRIISATILSLLALLGYGIFTVYLLGQTSMTDVVWTRTAYVFNGVETIAFAAAGFLFGSEVHRKQAENAEQRADVAGKQVTDAVRQAADVGAKGSSLAAAIRAKQKGLKPGLPGIQESNAGDNDRLTHPTITELVALADELFPR
jgi:hypothetical protein